MIARFDTLLGRLERGIRADDSIEGERLRLAVRSRLLDQTVPETKIARYVVLRQLGAGGMGVVYAAYDGELDRAVAIKLVRHARVARHAKDQERLIREARALAKLSHPNVVAIYDVGLHRDRVYIAMELVRGKTLRSWPPSDRHAWRSIVAAYAQAGEGLAAAHAVGLTHRDFKPDNALIGDDGRVRVVDFGLASGLEAIDEAMATDPDGGGHRLGSLTETGKVVGTPRYMAPEQFNGHPADAKSDQFGFCVSLWEALYGEPPCSGRDVARLADANAAAEIRPAADAATVPAWVRSVLLRGLAADPAARWPSMRALLDALARDPTRRRRILVGIGMAALSLAAALFGAKLLDSQRAKACAEHGEALVATWNPATATAITAAFVGTGLPYAATTADRLRSEIDDWTNQWAAVRTETCVAATIDGTLDADARARRDACLDEHAARLQQLVAIARAPDRDVINGAVRSVLALPPNTDCANDARLAAQAAALDPATTLSEVAMVRRDLSRARVLGVAGHEAAAMLAIDAAIQRAAALADSALQAEAWLGRGEEHHRNGAFDDAVRDHERAYFTAVEVGADEVAIAAATQLVAILGVRQSRFDDALAWARHAQVLLGRVGDSRDWRAAMLHEHTGNVRRLAGDFDGALADHVRVLELRIAYGGPDHPQVGVAWLHLGGVQIERGDLHAADQAFARAARIFDAAHGADSLDAAAVAANRCSAAYARENYGAALGDCERALRIREGRLEPDHPIIAISLTNLANVRAQRNEIDEARALLMRALEIRRARFGTDHPDVASALNNLGVIEAGAGDLAAAKQHLAEALAIRRQAFAADHPERLNTEINVADLELALGDPDAASARYEAVASVTRPGQDRVGGLHERALAGLAQARSAERPAAKEPQSHSP